MMKTARSRFGTSALAVAAGALLVSAVPAYAYVYSSEAQWASWSQGAWTIYNDVWGNPNPSQWLNVSSINQWNVSSNQPAEG
jgi:hypothetical protein